MSQRVPLLLLLVLSLPALVPRQARSSPPPAGVGPGSDPAMLVFLDRQGRLHWTPIEAGSEILKRTSLADACGGGSCQTPGGMILNCPTSGGPTCTSTQYCGCQCGRSSLGGWTSANVCGGIE